jgi:hypothetical protein
MEMLKMHNYQILARSLLGTPFPSNQPLACVFALNLSGGEFCARILSQQRALRVPFEVSRVYLLPRCPPRLDPLETKHWYLRP